MAKIKDVFTALSDPIRRKILKMLKENDMTPGDMIIHFDITKPTLTHHLQTLRVAELVRTQRDKQHIIYSLNQSVFEEVAEVMFDMFGKKGSSGNREARVEKLRGIEMETSLEADSDREGQAPITVQVTEITINNPEPTTDG
ncbi:MAG: autorepressor SdpR family transcription factor [Candidatus Dojkabacteria bacterium]|nr:MAG: autorepressor SdpR family transcription factor [Candidatus Dojkabacteria bacterium]